jgi:asparaginyl-tRNA synthetase
MPKIFSFIEMNDGSCLANIQVIADHAMDNYDAIRKLTTGSAATVIGALIPSQGKGQQWEIQGR